MPSPSKPTQPSETWPKDWNYEKTLSQIEAITHQLETGELPLADVFERFSEAVSALQQCDRFLQEKQTQASLLIETLVDANLEDNPD
ncbi:MAG: exodeoxyribonuclease VII small subunit [Phormidesmis sp.]